MRRIIAGAILAVLLCTGRSEALDFKAPSAATPSGTAGGDLGGTYPNPTVVSGANIGAASIPNAALAVAPLTAASTLDTTKLSAAAIPSGVTGSPAIALTNVTGTLPTAATAALTGDVTKPAGSNATTAVGVGGVAFGPLATQGTVTAQGTIASGGTLTCPFSATTTVCTATVGGGNFTIGTPTGGVANTQYQIILTSTASVTATMSSGFTISSPNNNAQATPNTFTTMNSGTTVIVNFHYNGTNYALDQQPSVYAKTMLSTSFQGGTISGSTGSFSGVLKSTVGAGANPAAVLTTFGTCNSGTEGLYATQSDSAVACVAGVTAAAGGVTHCGLYCNGSNWVRTGL